MIDPKDWKVGDIVRVKGGDRDWPIARVLHDGSVELNSRSGLAWRLDDLVFVRTAEAERGRLAPVPVSLRTMKTDVFSVTHNEFTVTFPPTAKTVNVSVHPETKCSVNGTVVQSGLESPKDAKPHPFYVGQRLICVDDDGAMNSLKKGGEYYATDCYDENVTVGECGIGWLTSRFKPAPFKVGDKVKILPGCLENVKIDDLTITSVNNERVGFCDFQWLRFDGKSNGWDCSCFHLVTPAPEKPEPRFKPGDHVCCVKPIDGSHLVPASRLKVDHVNRGESLTVKSSVAHLGDEIVSFVEFNDISFDAKNFRQVDSFKVGDYVKCRRNPRKIQTDYADFKVGEVCFVTDIGFSGWVQLQGKSSLYYDPAYFAPCEAPKEPEPAPFRVGDVVTCVDAPPPRNPFSQNRLVMGGDYCVTSVEQNGQYSYLCVAASGSTYVACGCKPWRADRFVHKVIKKPAQATFCGVDMGKLEPVYGPSPLTGALNAYAAQLAALNQQSADVSALQSQVQKMWQDFAEARKATKERLYAPKPWSGLVSAIGPFKVGDVVICTQDPPDGCSKFASKGTIGTVSNVAYHGGISIGDALTHNERRFKLYEPKFSPMDLVECIDSSETLLVAGLIYEVVSSSADEQTTVVSGHKTWFASNRFKIHKTADQRMVEAIEAGKVPDIADSVQDVRDKMIEAAKRPVGHIIGHPEQTVGRFESGRLYPTSPQAYFAMQEANSKGGYFQITWT